MRWAKTFGGISRFDLTRSAVPPVPLPPVPEAHCERYHPSGDGDRALECLIAQRYGVPSDHVLFVSGTTMANFLLAWTVLSRGDPVAVEEPVYENMPALVDLLGAGLISLPRRPENRYRVDTGHVEAALAAGARLIILTDLHNPTGVHLRDDDLDAARALAARHGARILLDEVYRDFLPGRPGTAYRPDDPTVLVTSSLTKVYGLGSLRAGWVFCPPAQRARVAEVVDYLTVLPPAAAATGAEMAWSDIDARQDRARAATAPGREAFARWVASRPDVDCVLPDAGVTAFPRLRGFADTTALCEWLRAERETALVPGRFFGDPTRVRLAAGAPLDVLLPGLERLEEAIDRFTPRP